MGSSTTTNPWVYWGFGVATGIPIGIILGIQVFDWILNTFVR